MKKKAYIKPHIEILDADCKGALLSSSVNFEVEVAWEEEEEPQPGSWDDMWAD
ncbi:MAG: hypothetical protein J5486_06860 [Bacteroidaceae bacterium]|nr:hypothetical protein [Bacteroidaceae bacterium]